jgi:inhibitor of cysteine peptidase
MMKFLTLTLAFILVAASSLACAARAQGESKGPTAATVEVSCDEFQAPGKAHLTRTVDMAVGATLTVSLCQNPSTGFSWEQAVISDSTVLTQTGDSSVPVEQATPVVGAPNTHVWTFKAMKAGQSAVSMSYSRPWAGGEKGVWTFALTVNVK